MAKMTKSNVTKTLKDELSPALRERFDEARRLLEKEENQLQKEILEWWNNMFSDDLGLMIKELDANEQNVLSVKYNNKIYRFTKDRISPCGIVHIRYRRTGKGSGDSLIGFDLLPYEHEPASSLDGLERWMRDNEMRRNNFEFLKKESKDIAEAITRAYVEKIESQSQRIDSIFHHLGKDITKKKCKVSIQWV